MLELLASGWLAALGALALPLALHLFGRGHQRRVAVGSVVHLRPAPTRRGRRLRPSDWPLLLLRCALLAFVALALAEPRWRGRARQPIAPEPWVLADARLLRLLEEGGAAARETPILAARLAALREEGATVRALADPDAGGVEVSDLWSLLRAADARAPAGVPFELLAFDRLSVLAGARPALARPVAVHVAPEPGENLWLDRARRRRDGALAVRVGRSSALRTTFASFVIHAGAAGAAGIDVASRGEAVELRLRAGGDEPGDDTLLVRPTAQARALLRRPAERAGDEAFLRAGLETAAEAAALELEIRSETSGDGSPAAAPAAEPGILFLLGRQPSEAEAAWVEAGGWLVAEEAVAESACDARAQPPPGLAAPLDAPLRLRRCPADAEAGAGTALGPTLVPTLGPTLWSDGAGRALLAGARRGRGVELRLRGRLSPEVWDLPLDVALPAALLALVEARWPAPSAALPGSDRRAAGAAAIAPERAVSDAPRRSSSSARSARPESLAWLTLVALFAAERLRARRETV